MKQPVERRLAAILAADVAGYSRLMGEDEAGTARMLREHRTAADPLVVEHGGRIVKTTGDGVLIEFGSVVGAVECALALQRLAAERNAGIAGERRMEWRIGIHLGDVLVEGDDILGDGVNIAARLEGIAEPGGICVSEDAFRQVRGKVEAEFADIGEQSLKNIARPLRVYRAGPKSPLPSPLAQSPVQRGTSVTRKERASSERTDKRLRIMMGPFEAAGVDPEQRYLVSGFRHQLISSLVRFREWSLIDGARESTLAAAADQAAYLISASSYQLGGQLQLVLTLSDMLTGEYIWSQDVSADLETWFPTQKLVVRRLAIALNVRLSVDRLDRNLGQPDVSLPLYDRWLRGEALMARWRGTSWTEAAEICRSIIAEAPNFAPAYCTVVNFTNSRSHLFPGEIRTIALKREALDLACVAVQLDPTFSRTHLCAAWSYALNGYYDQAELSFEMAYELNENDPWTLIASSLGIAFCGRQDIAERRAHLALELGLCIEPRHWGYQAVIRFLCHDYQGCIDAADRSQDAIYNFAAWKAAALTHLGRHDAARAEWHRFVGMVSQDWHGEEPPNHEIITRWLLQGFPIKSLQDWERLRDGIAGADVPLTALAS